MENCNNSTGCLCVYTRTAKEGIYPSSLAQSIHMAYSEDRINYQPLNQNYGMIFPLATLSDRNTINEMGIRSPYIFHSQTHGFIFAGLRVNGKGEEDVESKGCILIWTSKDGVESHEQGLLRLSTEEYIKDFIIQLEETLGQFVIRWKGENGQFYENYLQNFHNLDRITQPVKSQPFKRELCDFNIEGAMFGNSIDIDSNFGKELLKKWSPIYHVSTKVPEYVAVTNADELKKVLATATYSDRSIDFKRVNWNLSEVDFDKKRKYQITGKIEQRFYDFPLAIGYADPQVFYWKGKYYFIATNDNLQAIGLFVREGDSVEELFAPGVKEYLILDKDEEKRFLCNFWAPELHIINDRVHVLLAIQGDYGPQSHIMALKEGGSIVNPSDWEVPIRVMKKDGSNLCDKGITLDMTYLHEGGISYLIWSERYNLFTPEDSGSMICIGTVNPEKPWILTSDPVLLSRPMYGWENNHGTINNEGPYPLVTDNKVYIAISGGAAGGYSYAIGYLMIDRGEDLLDPSAWKKTTTPALSYYSVEGEYGPGHNTFFVDEMGKTMISYHGQQEIGPSARCTAVRRVHFNVDGFPVLNLSKERDIREELQDVQMTIEVI